jgi:hypothetical protein
MDKFSFFIVQETGELYNPIVYGEEQTPPDEATPPGCELMHVSTSTSDFTIIKALMWGGNIELASEYIPVSYGGLYYSYEEERFKFRKKPEFNILNAVREHRDALLADTDDMVLVPDLPGNLMQITLDYRQALRDLTKNANPNWEKIEDFPWPDKPLHIYHPAKT